MADSGSSIAGAAGNAYHAVVDSGNSAAAIADAAPIPLEETIKKSAELVREALSLTGDAMEKAVESASNAAFDSAANVGANIASPPAIQHAAQNAFSWGGYFQALGFLCLLLALLWFAVWLIRKYGKFNFLPKPGSLPKNSLVMEAQMPLGPKKGVMVIRFMDRRLLLGVTEHQITLLTEEKAFNEQQDKDFQSYLPDTASESGNNRRS